MCGRETQLLNVPDDTCRDLLFGTEAEDGEDDQGGQNRREEVDARHSEGVAVAVVVLGIVRGVSNDRAKAKAQRKEDLGGRLPPHLHVSPDFQLQFRTETRLNISFSALVFAIIANIVCTYLRVEHVGDSIHGAL